MQIQLEVKKDETPQIRFNQANMANIYNDDDTIAGHVAACGSCIEIRIGEETYTISVTEIWNKTCQTSCRMRVLHRNQNRRRNLHHLSHRNLE